jgi:sugar phosphate isomerase/epimerase
MAYTMANIKIGWQMNGLKSQPFEKTLEWAKSINVQTVELPAWPQDKICDVDKILAGNKAMVLEPLKKTGIEAATIVYCTNLLDSDDKKRNEYHTHFKKVIDVAHTLEVPIVACFVGSNGTRNLYPEMAAFEEHFIPLLEYAKDQDIKLAIENCPAGGNNIGNNPKMWDTLIFEVADEFDNLGLEFDPSHLVWLQVDWAAALDEFLEKGKVFCCHAKDTKMNMANLKREGILSMQPTWWKARMPGLGDVDWKLFMDILKKHDFNGAVQIEHEDPDYGGNKYQEGIKLGIEHLYKSMQ